MWANMMQRGVNWEETKGKEGKYRNCILIFMKELQFQGQM